MTDTINMFLIIDCFGKVVGSYESRADRDYELDQLKEMGQQVGFVDDENDVYANNDREEEYHEG